MTTYSSLHSLFGNKLRDYGVLTLLSGIAELQEQTVRTAAAIQMLVSSEQLPQRPTGWSSFGVFALIELDIGRNGLSSNGVRLLASCMRYHSHLQYLGLARTSSVDLAAWKELFDSLRGNSALSQIMPAENSLRPGGQAAGRHGERKHESVTGGPGQEWHQRLGRKQYHGGVALQAEVPTEAPEP